MMRSPTGSGVFGRSDSQPNLSISEETHDVQSPVQRVTFRSKRKLTDDNETVASELSEMRKQMTTMMGMLTTLNANQQEFIKKMNGDITDIKEQITEIKSVTDSLTVDQKIIKLDVANILNKNTIVEKRIKSLENDVQKLMDSEPVTFVPTVQENIMSELCERNVRSKNLVIVGITEPNSTDSTERQNKDKSEVLKIIRNTYADCPEPCKITRLGKFKPNKNRPVKVSFASEETAKNILRNKVNGNNDPIKIYNDQTPQQRQYLMNLKEKLKERKESGEINLIIKYIRGVPKIVEAQPKNLE